MLRVRIKIGDSQIVDTQDEYGFIYLDSDKRFAAPTKGFESSSYAEQEGENIIPETVDAPFDYKVKFFIQASTTDDANKKIKAFNDDLYTKTGDIKTFKQVAFYNDYKRHKIVGYPQPISEATEFWQDGIPVSDPRHKNINDIVIVEWTIRVTKPSLCEYVIPFSDDSGN